MRGIKGLLNSKRSVFAILVAALATTLVFLGKIDGGQWVGLMKFLSVALIAGHTFTGTTDLTPIPTATASEKQEA